MKKYNVILTFLLIAIFALTLCVFVGCNENGNKGPVSLEEFTDSSVTAEIGSRYVPDMTAVKDTEGNEYPLIIRAYNSKETEIGVTDGQFQVTDFNGYTVKYSAIINDEEIIRTVTVSVTDTTKPTLTILGLRTEREVGTIAWPYVNVTDNSGEKLSYTIDVVAADSSLGDDAITKTDEVVTFNTPGTYKFVASATDSHGNVGTAEKEVIITESMGRYVWENFENPNHMETVKNTTYLTSMTQSSWLEEFNGAKGVAKIQPNYSKYYNNNFFVQLGLPKTQSEILACDWDYFVIRLYVTVKDADKITLANGDGLIFGEYETKKWINLRIDKKTYLDKANNYMFPGFLGNEDISTRTSAFAAAVTDPIPRPMFCVSVRELINSIELSDVVIYIDEITWGNDGPDVKAPEVVLNGAAWNVLSNSKMTLPEVTVTDDRDPMPWSAKKFYKVNGSTDVEIPIEGNKVQIGEAGTYKLVVNVKDYSGNTASHEFVFIASDELDYTKLASYDYANHIGGFSGELSWLQTFNGANGVMKITVGAGEHLNATFNKEYMQKAVEAGWDYINIRMWVECSDYTEQFRFYNWLSNLDGDKPQKQWVDFKISVKALANQTLLGNNLTRKEVYSKFNAWYVDAFSDFMYCTGSVNDFRTGTIDIYIDEITWGVNPPDVTPPTISASGVWKTAKGAEYTLPAFSAFDDGMEIAIDSVVMYKEGSDVPLTITDGKIVLTELGQYRIVVKATDDAGNTATATYFVTVVETIDEKEIATYDSASEIGILGTHVNKTATSFVESFTDKDGVTKTGLMKFTFNGNNGAEIITLNLPKNISDKAKEGKFDYIELTICVNNDTNYNNSYKSNVYSLYSFNVSLPAYQSADALECKKWQTVRIPLATINNAGSYLGAHATIDEAREAFLSYYTGNTGYFFNLSSWFAGQTVEMYVDSISWGVNPPDVTPPKITATGVWKTQIGSEYTLPEFKAEDNGVEIAVSSVKMYKEGSDTPLAVTNGKIVLNELGRYSIVVTATDEAGNTATETYYVTVVEAIDEKVIASYDSQSELGVLGTYVNADAISFEESYMDKDGVTKTGLMKFTFSGNNGAEIITLNLSQEIADKAKQGNFDYIELTICVKNDTNYNNEYKNNIYSLYSFNVSVPQYQSADALECGKWQTVRIYLSDINADGSYLSSYPTTEAAREAFLNYYTGNAGYFFNLSSWFEGQTVEMYVDSISWGVGE